ncbi:histidine acid phosphatase superfamily protein [Cystoisospora suis]|uniref:Histidine acid phosphatase superfamily protein n=1 Tax=Cystoisospora suis TaxID=483139 RepID=A0A2C6KLL4_9APIC|nr:histidine acid phosphatase superfamily protein [Cystoisospora suis]
MFSSVFARSKRGESAWTPPRCPRLAFKLLLLLIFGFVQHFSYCFCTTPSASTHGIPVQVSPTVGKPRRESVLGPFSSDSGTTSGADTVKSEEESRGRDDGEFTKASQLPIEGTEALNSHAEEGRLRPVRYPAYCLKCGDEVVRHRSVPPLSDASRALPLLLLQVNTMVRHGSRTPCAGTCWRWRRKRRCGESQAVCQGASGGGRGSTEEEASKSEKESEKSEAVGGNFLERLFIRFQKFFGVKPTLSKKNKKEGNVTSNSSNALAFEEGSRLSSTIQTEETDGRQKDSARDELLIQGENEKKDDANEVQEEEEEDETEEEEEGEGSDDEETSQMKIRPPSILQAAWSLSSVSSHAQSLLSDEPLLPRDSYGFVPFFFSPFLRTSAFFSSAFSNLSLSFFSNLPSREEEHSEHLPPKAVATSDRRQEVKTARMSSVGSERSLPTFTKTERSEREASTESSLDEERNVQENDLRKSGERDDRESRHEESNKKERRKVRPWNCLFEEGGFFLSKTGDVSPTFLRVFDVKAKRSSLHGSCQLGDLLQEGREQLIQIGALLHEAYVAPSAGPDHHEFPRNLSTSLENKTRDATLKAADLNDDLQEDRKAPHERFSQGRQMLSFPTRRDKSSSSAQTGSEAEKEVVSVKKTEGFAGTVNEERSHKETLLPVVKDSYSPTSSESGSAPVQEELPQVVGVHPKWEEQRGTQREGSDGLASKTPLLFHSPALFTEDELEEQRGWAVYLRSTDYKRTTASGAFLAQAFMEPNTCSIHHWKTGDISGDTWDEEARDGMQQGEPTNKKTSSARIHARVTAGAGPGDTSLRLLGGVVNMNEREETKKDQEIFSLVIHVQEFLKDSLLVQWDRPRLARLLAEASNSEEFKAIQRKHAPLYQRLRWILGNLSAADFFTAVWPDVLFDCLMASTCSDRVDEIDFPLRPPAIPVEQSDASSSSTTPTSLSSVSARLPRSSSSSSTSAEGAPVTSSDSSLPQLFDEVVAAVEEEAKTLSYWRNGLLSWLAVRRFLRVLSHSLTGLGEARDVALLVFRQAVRKLKAEDIRAESLLNDKHQEKLSENEVHTHRDTSMMGAPTLHVPSQSANDKGAHDSYLSTALDEANESLRRYQRETRDPRFFVYATHDTSLAALLAALGIPNDQWPPYASTLIVEVYVHLNEGTPQSPPSTSGFDHSSTVQVKSKQRKGRKDTVKGRDLKNRDRTQDENLLVRLIWNG